MKRDAPLYEPLLHLALINTDGLPISGVLWFFTCLFVMEIICFFLFEIENEKKRYIICAIIIISAYLLNSILHIRLPWASDVAIISIPFFLFGYYSNSANGKKFIVKLFELDVMKTITCILVGTILIFINGYVNLRTAHYGNLVLFYFDALLLSIAIMNISRWIDSCTKNKVSLWIENYLKRIGRNSVIYLCTNQVIIMAINMVISKLMMAKMRSNAINEATLVLIGTLFIEEVMVVIFSKTRLKIFIGRKKKE